MGASDRECPGCGAWIERAARRCIECGTRVTPMKPPPPPGSWIGVIAPLVLMGVMLGLNVSGNGLGFASVIAGRATGAAESAPIEEGQKGHLYDPDGPTLFLAKDLDIWQKMEGMTEEELDGLMRQGSLFQVPSGVKVEVVKVPDTALELVEVRIAEGPGINQRGWIGREYVVIEEEEPEPEAEAGAGAPDG